MTNEIAIEYMKSLKQMHEGQKMAEQAIDLAIEALIFQKNYSWIFYDPEPWNEKSEKLNRVEEALGIRLYTWQRTFIYGRGFRRFGDTTAKILSELLDEKDDPIILVRSSPSQYFYNRELVKIKQKLDNFGIKTREIIQKNEKTVQKK